MASGEFEVNASAFPVRRFVLDPNVRHGNLSSHELQPVRLGDGMFGRGRLTFFSTLREVTIEPFLQFVVEDDAKVTASFALDLFGRLLIKAIEVGIVMGFARLDEPAIQGLTFACPLRLNEKAVSVFGEGKELAGAD